MQIVIEIDENLYTRLFDNGGDDYDYAVDMATAIRKGTPLPEHHGRLIDESKITSFRYKTDVMHGTGNNYYLKMPYIEIIDTDAPTIIEGSDSGE